MASDISHILAALPWGLLTIVLLFATVFPHIVDDDSLLMCSSKGRNVTETPCQRPIGHAVVEQTWWLPQVAFYVNKLISSTGPLLPYLLLAVQVLTGTVGRVNSNIFGDRGPHLAVILYWAIMTALRIGTFIILHPYNYYFSDHIFLLNSMMAQIEMSLFMTFQFQDPDSRWFRLELASGCTLVLLILFEAFITSWLYHTLLASWVAWLVSTLVFQGMAGFWMYKTAKPESAGFLKTKLVDT